MGCSIIYAIIEFLISNVIREKSNSTKPSSVRLAFQDSIAAAQVPSMNLCQVEVDQVRSNADSAKVSGFLTGGSNSKFRLSNSVRNPLLIAYVLQRSGESKCWCDDSKC